MKIEFDVTQEDIEKASFYMDNNNCLGCTVLKRVLGVKEMSLGGQDFCIERGLRQVSDDIRLGLKFSYYLAQTILKKAKPEKHSIDIPDSLLEQIGYFDKKSDTYVESYITSKENNIEDKINHDGQEVEQACQD